MPLAFLAALICDMTPAAAGAGNTTFVLTRPLTILDFEVIGTATQAGGTITIHRQPAAGGGFVAATDAVPCAVIDTKTLAVQIVQAQAAFAIGDSLRLVVAGVATLGRAIVHGSAGVIPGGT